MPLTLAGANKLHDTESIVGTTFNVFIENRTKDGYIVSRKRYLKSLIPNAIEELEYNKLYSGFVTGTTDYGVFAQFNDCLTGLIYKPYIDVEQVPNIKDLKPGTPINFYIKEIIRDTRSGRDKIILAQILKEMIWDTIKIGNEYEGTIKEIKNISSDNGEARQGALVVLDEVTSGLVRLPLNHEFKIGSKINTKVTEILKSNRRIYLELV